MALITYTNKSTMNENADIPAINKVQASDMNQIKEVVNSNYNEQQPVEITSEFTFNETVAENTHIFKSGKFIYVFYQGEGKAHTGGTSLVSIPSSYLPSNAFFVPFTKMSGGVVGTLNVNPEGYINVGQISNTTTVGRIYAAFVYITQ